MSPVQKFPADPLKGQAVPVFPLTYLVYDRASGLDTAFIPRAPALRRVDSVINQVLADLGPEVLWAPPDSLRQAARKAPGLLADPDRMATSRLRTYALQTVPEPLRAQLRTLTAATGGGRYALVPAGLTVTRIEEDRYLADLTYTLVDTRMGAVSWSSTLRGNSLDIWDAVAQTARLLLP